jgi:hypothetical protein
MAYGMTYRKEIMKRKIHISTLIIILLISSAVLYGIQIAVFQRYSDTQFYFLQDMAFLPISVLLVTLGLNTVIVRQERKEKKEKVSVVINEFFAETGTELVIALRSHMANLEGISPKLQLAADWQDKDFSASIDAIAKYSFQAELVQEDLQSLRDTLVSKKDHLLRLFENANLMEQDRFTGMLWAVYHVYDELRSRESLNNLPANDILHLNLDIQRAYQILLIEWIESMRILKRKYPYLYSLAVRKCPFGSGDVMIH